MGKGTKTTTTQNTLPPEFMSMLTDSVDMAKHIGQIGYVPYSGNQIVAPSGSTRAAMEGANHAAAAFGIPTPSVATYADGTPASGDASSRALFQQIANILSGSAVPGAPSGQVNYSSGLTLPTNASVDAAGITGYSPAPIYQEAVGQIPSAQKAAIQSYVMDPHGAAPVAAAASTGIATAPVPFGYSSHNTGPYEGWRVVANPNGGLAYGPPETSIYDLHFGDTWGGGGGR